ncbi:MAG: hypothetical protein SOT34_00440 [Candidatus Borkfalkiaceae bacterium]|nr:hypothetical protein [Christensenellaceae bacterium]
MCKLIEMIANVMHVQGLSDSLYWCVKTVCGTAILITVAVLGYLLLSNICKCIKSCVIKKRDRELFNDELSKCNCKNSNDETEVVVPCEKNSKISINVQAKNNNSLKLFVDNQNQKEKDETDQKQKNDNQIPKENEEESEVGDQGNSDPKKE